MTSTIVLNDVYCCRSYSQVQVAAPSRLRIRAPFSTAGSKFAALTAIG